MLPMRGGRSNWVRRNDALVFTGEPDQIDEDVVATDGADAAALQVLERGLRSFLVFGRRWGGRLGGGLLHHELTS